MRLFRILVSVALLTIVVVLSASGQTAKKQDSTDNAATAPVNETAETSKAAPSAEDEPQTWLHLVDGRRILVAEATQDTDGFWFKVGNVATFVDRERVARIERVSPKKTEAENEALRGSGNWKISDATRVEDFFLRKFGRRLPSSTIGQSDLHTRWGFDHRNGMDVGLHPDSVEGRGLIEFLRSEGIPFLTFRGAVPGVSTGPHIHVGNPSRRLSAR
jgi:hypothetical protein